MSKALLRILRYGISGLVVLLLLWVILGNLIASLAKRDADAQLEAYIEERLAHRPRYNDSALELMRLSAKLGVRLKRGIDTELDRQVGKVLDLDAYPEKSDAFATIREQLSDYIDRQQFSATDGFEAIPPELQDFLTKNEAQIRAIQTHLVSQQTPTWEFPEHAIKGIESRDILIISALPLPAFLSHTNLNDVLLLQLVQDSQMGNHVAVRQGWQASWKFAQSLHLNPTLISALVQIIQQRDVVGILRKVEYLDTDLNDLDNYSYHTILDSLKDEFFGFQYAGISGSGYVFPFGLSVIFNGALDDAEWFQFNESTLKILKPILQPMGRPLAVALAINTFDTSLKTLERWESNPPNICDPTEDFYDSFGNSTWWNWFEKTSVPAFFSQPLKGLKHQLELELTQHILHAKNIAAKTGKWPQTLPNLESSVCPRVTWNYSVDSNGKMTLKLPSYSPWLKERLTPDKNGNINTFPMEFSTDQIPTVVQP